MLGLGERAYIDLELEAAKEMGDSDRAQVSRFRSLVLKLCGFFNNFLGVVLQACRSRMWELDGEEDACANARKEMSKEKMTSQLAKAKEFVFFFEMAFVHAKRN